MLFRPDIVLRDGPAEGTEGGGGEQNIAFSKPGERQPRAGAAVTTDAGTATLKGVTGAATTRKRQRESLFRERQAMLAKAVVDADIEAAQAKQNIENADKLENFAAGLQQLEQEALQSSMENAHNVQQLGRMVGSFRPRPGRLFQDSSAAATWGAAMSLAAGAFQSERSGGANSALEIINTAIKQDIAAQELQYEAMAQELGSAQTLYSQMRASYGDAITARVAQRAALTEAAAARLKAAGSEHFGDRARYAAIMAGEVMTRKANEQLIKMAELEFTIKSKRGAATAGEQLMGLLPHDLQAKLYREVGQRDLQLMHEMGLQGAQQFRAEAESQQAASDANKAKEKVILDAMGAEEREERQRQQRERRAPSGGARPPAGAAPAPAAEGPPQAPVEAPAPAQGRPSAAPAGSNERSMQASAREQAAAAQQAVVDAEAALKVAQQVVAMKERTRPGGDRRYPTVDPEQRASEEKWFREMEALEANVAEAEAEVGRQQERAAERLALADRLGAEAGAAEEGAAAAVASEQAAAAEAATEAEDAAIAQSLSEGGARAVAAQLRDLGTGEADRRTYSSLLAESKESDVVEKLAGEIAPTGTFKYADALAPGSGGSDKQRKEALDSMASFLSLMGGSVNMRGNTQLAQQNADVGALGNLGQQPLAFATERQRALYQRFVGQINPGKVPTAFAFRVKPGGTFGFGDLAAQAQDMSDQLGVPGGSQKGMTLRVATRPVTIMQKPTKWDPAKGKFVETGGAAVPVKINAPVAVASSLSVNDDTAGQPFFSESGDGFVGERVPDYMNGGRRNLIGSEKEKAETRKALSGVSALKEFAQAMVLYAGVFNAAGGQSFNEWLDEGVEQVSPQDMLRAWEQAKKDTAGTMFAIPASAEPPIAQNEAGEWVINPNNSTAKRLGIVEYNGEFTVSANKFGGDIGSLSHLVGFKAPQQAEMKLLKEMTGAKSAEFLDPRTWYTRDLGGANNPQGAARAFSRFLETKVQGIYDMYTVDAAGAADLYHAATRVMSGGEGMSQKVDLGKLLNKAKGGRGGR